MFKILLQLKRATLEGRQLIFSNLAKCDYYNCEMEIRAYSKPDRLSVFKTCDHSFHFNCYEIYRSIRASDMCPICSQIE